MRPVLLTTLTTVLGLAPLLYETSSQAQFLKPTVVTLCYGLGFGMVLVLLVVPALIAIGEDFGRAKTALMHGLRFRVARVRAAYLAGVAVLLAWLAATLGAFAVNGAMAGPLAQMFPQVTSLQMAFALFVSGAAVMALVAYIVAGSLVAVRRKRA